jgi:hypothetical protein
MDYNNYGRISLLSTSYKILPNLLSSRMTPYENGIIGKYPYVFMRTTYFSFCKYLKRSGNAITRYVSYLWILKKPMTP